MKIACLMSGQMRTLDQCAESLEKFILAPLRATDDVSLFVHAAADGDAHKAYEFLPDAEVVIDEQPDLDEKNYIHRTGKGVCGVQSVLRQLWSWREAWRMIETASGGCDFDFVVRLRADTLYYNEVEPRATWNPACLYAPRFSSFWGVCDRFGFGGRDVMRRWHCVWDRLDELIAAGYALHPESLVVAATSCEIRRTDILFSTVRSSGEIRTPQFLKSVGDVVA